MNVIIPVAGEGVRLKPHTHFLPKCLLYVAGKPILGHILEGLKSLNVSKVIIVLGKKSDSIVQFCKNYQFDFKFVVQKERLGLGHAIYLGARDVSGPTLVLLGDTIVDYDLKKFACGSISKLAVKEVDEPKRFGVVEIDGGYVKSVAEKPEEPKSNLAIVGLYYFADSKKVFWAMSNIIKKKIMTKNEYQLTDGLSFLLRRGEKFLAIRVKNWFDCGTPEALIKTNQHLLKKSHYCRTRRGCVIIKPVYIPDSVEIND
ncbi:MAG: nucleotidyltransferase family protein [candidate division WOR-3 bacterium]